MGAKNKLKLRRARIGNTTPGGLFRLNATNGIGNEDVTDAVITFSSSGGEIASIEQISGPATGDFNESRTQFGLLDYSAPGVFGPYGFRAVSNEGAIAEATATITLIDVVEPGGDTPDKVLNVAQAFANMRSVRVTFTAVTNVTLSTYEYMLADDGDWRSFNTAVDPYWVTALVPGVDLSLVVRAVSDTGIPGEASDQITISTEDDSDPPPTSGTVPIRAREVTDKVMMHAYITRASGDPHMAYRRGSGGNTGAYDTSGWLMGHYAPLAAIGVGRRLRTAVGYGGGPGHQVPQIINKLYDDFGVRIHGTLTMLTAAQRAVAGETAGVSSEQAIQNLHDDCLAAMASLQGVNEPNNGDYNDTNKYPGGWRTIVIDHTVVNRLKIDAVGGWAADFTYGSFSLWSRKLIALRELLYAGYVHNSAYLGGEMLHGTFSPYQTASGRQWLRDCLTVIDWINLHLYTGGWRPDTAGDTGGNVDNENGSDTASIDLRSTLDQYSELANGDKNYPVKCTEFGYELGGPGSGGTRTNYALRFLTENARCKFYQRWNFDLLDRFPIVNEGVWFEFMDNASQVPNSNLTPPKAGKIYGMLDYSLSGGVYTFTRRKLWYICYLTYKPISDVVAANAYTFTKTNLDFTIGNRPGQTGQMSAEIRHKLVQHSNGKHYLAVWYNNQGWRRTAPYSAANEQFGSRDLRLTLNNGVTKSIRTTRPYTDAQAATLNNTWTQHLGGTKVATFDFTVHDDILWIELTT